MKKIASALYVATLLGIAAPLYANDGAGLSAQGQLFLQLQQMQQEIATLRGMLEEQQHRITRLEEDSKDRFQALDSRISQNDTAAIDKEQERAEPGRGSQQQVASQPGDPEKEQQFYEAAYSLIQARDFERARQAFVAFLGRYPQGKFAANAHYWLGEIGLVQDDLQAAGKAFATVINDWPEHGKVPDSTYKLATVEQRLGRYERAAAMFRQVVEQFPDSSAASLARRELQRMQ